MSVSPLFSMKSDVTVGFAAPSFPNVPVIVVEPSPPAGGESPASVSDMLSSGGVVTGVLLPELHAVDVTTARKYEAMRWFEVTM